jgi:ABC-type nitrate/sulfonate/bicarbonate transport system permease component
LGIGQALITGVAGEIVLSGSGLGAMMWDSQQTLRTDIVFLCLFSLAVIGVAATALLSSFDRILFPWRPHAIQ